jgi:multiple sugar transport system ATP-binding protein
MRGRSAKEIEPAVHLAAARVELMDYLQRRPKELSGGQRQRVALARAIVREPAVFLMDEPLSNLDAKLRVSMRAHLKHLHHQLRTTTVYVTHDQIEAMSLADRVVVMSQAEVQQIGTPEAIYNDPANLFVAGFVGSPPMNLINGELNNGVFEGSDVRIAGFAALTRANVVLGVRAEDLVLIEHARGSAHSSARSPAVSPAASSADAPSFSPADAQIHGEVFSCELTGDATLVTLQCGAHRVTAKAGKTTRADVGEAMGFAADAARCFLFDATTQARLRFATLGTSWC